jgi:hypothetical protein
MLRGIYSAIYDEVNVSVSGGYVLQYAGDTSASCFICVALKSWSGRKILDLTTYQEERLVTRDDENNNNNNNNKIIIIIVKNI